MKLIKLFIYSAILTVMSSCTNDAVYSTEIDKHMVSIPAVGGKVEINVKANSAWDVLIEDGSEWINTSIEHSEALHASFFIIVESANTTGKTRTGNVVIKNGDSVRSIQVTQEFSNVNLEACLGDWKMTKIDALPAMLNSTFTFNEDMTCKAHLFLPGNRESNVVGTFEFNGNIITINSKTAEGKDEQIVITVQDVTENELFVIVNNSPATLTRVK